LASAPEAALRRLFNATALSVRYDPRQKLAVCQVTLDEGSLSAVDQAATTVTSPDSAASAGTSEKLPAASEATADTQHRQPGALGMRRARSEGFEPPTF
jgi:hypothetical protein